MSKKLKLYLIFQNQNHTWDTYDSAVVATTSEERAKNTDPSTGNPVKDWNRLFSSWCSSPEHVSVVYLGVAEKSVEEGVVCASFNAG